MILIVKKVTRVVRGGVYKVDYYFHTLEQDKVLGMQI